MTSYYNEIDPYCAAWLRELIKAGHIAPGIVDERPIQEVTPADVQGFTQCHFFAGIGGWSYALRLAGWGDARAVWTGSCPCQPFSAAGRKRGVSDERHLWPVWFPLIRECRPPVVFGEQVASKDGLSWFDAVSTDLEGAEYAVGAADLCAAGVSAPHIRQRLYFVGDSALRRGRSFNREPGAIAQTQVSLGRSSISGQFSDGPARELADTHEMRRGGRTQAIRWQARNDASGGGERLVYANDARSQGRLERGNGPDKGTSGASGLDGFWRDPEWIPCQDGKSRPIEPGTFPLAHGIPARVGRLRGYGNAIVPQVAQVFIESYMEAVS